MASISNAGGSNVKVNIRRLAKHSERMRALSKVAVKTGIQSDAGEYENGIRLVDIAVMQAFGTERNGRVHIPARPFLSEAVRRYKGRIRTAAIRLAKLVGRGELTAEQASAQLGVLMTQCIQNTLRTGPWTPLAPSTIAKKKSDVPLIDTGFLVNSIRHEVVTL